MNITEFIHEIYKIDDCAKITLKPSFYHESSVIIHINTESKCTIDWLIIANNPSYGDLIADLDLILSCIKKALNTNKNALVSVGHDSECLTSIRIGNNIQD